MIKKIKKKAKQLKMKILILYKVLGDKKCGVFPRVLIWITLGLFLSPIDLIPDFIPILGYLDDIIIIPLLIMIIIKILPDEVMSKAEEEVKNGERVENKKVGFVAAGLIIMTWIVIGIKIYLRIIK